MVRYNLSLRPLIREYTIRLAFASGMYLMLSGVWGRLMLIQFSAFLHSGLDVDGLRKVWFMFAWIGVVSAIHIAAKQREPSGSRSRWSLLGIVLTISLLVGIVEEVIYRCFIFFSMMVVLTFCNTVTSGLVQWFYVQVSIPIANALTFQVLRPELLNSNWIVGAAILSANAIFAGAHVNSRNTFKLNAISVLNAWVIGMVLFYLVFNYGLFTAIAAHVLYDALVLSTLVLAHGKEGFARQWFRPKQYQSRYSW